MALRLYLDILKLRNNNSHPPSRSTSPRSTAAPLSGFLPLTIESIPTYHRHRNSHVRSLGLLIKFLLLGDSRHLQCPSYYSVEALGGLKTQIQANLLCCRSTSFPDVWSTASKEPTRISSLLRLRPWKSPVLLHRDQTWLVPLALLCVHGSCWSL